MEAPGSPGPVTCLREVPGPQAGSGHPAVQGPLLHSKNKGQNPTSFCLLEALQNQLFTDTLQINPAPVPVNLRTEGHPSTPEERLSHFIFPVTKSENNVKVLNGARRGRDGVSSSQRVTDAAILEARHASRKLKLLTFNVGKVTGAPGIASYRVSGHIPEFLFLLLPFSETATDPTTTKSTRTLESKPTGAL